VGLFLFGIRNHDEKYLVASSPFFSPYCPTSTLIGFWLMLVSKIESWILYLILISWWAVLIIPTVIK
jgi:hypothetical protein